MSEGSGASVASNSFCSTEGSEGGRAVKRADGGHSAAAAGHHGDCGPPTDARFLLGRADRCAHPELQRCMAEQDPPRLAHFASRILRLGGPERYRSAFLAWEASAASPWKAADGDTNPFVSEAALDYLSSEASPYRLGSLPQGITSVAAWPHAESEDEGEVGAAAAAVACSWPTAVLRLQAACRCFTDLGCKEFRYMLPHDTQVSLLPVLYAWVVHWPLAVRHPSIWTDVVGCFQYVAKGKRQFPRVPSPVVLSWRPLMELISAVITPCPEIELTSTFSSAVLTVGKHLATVCKHASDFFGPEALEDLWDHLAPRFTRSEYDPDASVALCVLAHLLPSFRLTDPLSGAALPRAQALLDFLFKSEPFCWQQGTPWSALSFRVVEKVYRHNYGVAKFDAAEPFFTALLALCNLPIGDSKKASPRLAAASNPFTRTMLKHVQLFDTADDKDLRMAAEALSVILVRDPEGNPVWNHLKRFLHAVDVFLRPASGSVDSARRIMVFLRTLVSGVLARLDTEERLARKDGTAAEARERETSERVTAARREGSWTAATRRHFVELLLPVATAATSLGNVGGQALFAGLCSVDAAAAFPAVMALVTKGLASSSDKSRTMVAELLTGCTYPFLRHTTVCAEFVAALAESIIPTFVGWLNPSQASVTKLVVKFLFAVTSAVPLRSVFGEGGGVRKEEEGVVLATLARQVSLFLRDNTVDEGFIYQMRTVLLQASAESFDHISELILRDALQRDSSGQQICLMCAIGERDPERVFRAARQAAVPVLLDPTAPDEELEWAADFLCGALRGAGLAAHTEHVMVLRCIQSCLRQVTSRVHIDCACSLLGSFLTAVKTAQCAPRGFLTPDYCVEGGGGGVQGTAAFPSSLLCDSAEAELEWRLPTQEHLSAVVSVLDVLVGDIIYVTERIEAVHPPLKSVSGLRSLVDDPGTESTAWRPEDVSRTARPVTPTNVLAGIADWLTDVTKANSEVYALFPQYQASTCGAPPVALETVSLRTSAAAEAGQASISVLPLMPRVRKAVWFPVSPDSRLPAVTPSALFEFIRVHFLWRALGHWEQELATLFGPDVSSLLDTTIVCSGKPPLLPGGADGSSAGDKETAGSAPASGAAASAVKKKKTAARVSQDTTALSQVHTAMANCCGYFTPDKHTKNSMLNLFFFYNRHPHHSAGAHSFPPTYWALRAAVLQNRTRQLRATSTTAHAFANMEQLLVFCSDGSTMINQQLKGKPSYHARHPALLSLAAATHNRTVRRLVQLWLEQNCACAIGTSAAAARRELAFFTHMSLPASEEPPAELPPGGSGVEQAEASGPPTSGEADARRLVVWRAMRALRPVMMDHATLCVSLYIQNAPLFLRCFRVLLFTPEAIDYRTIMMKVFTGPNTATSVYSPAAAAAVTERLIQLAGQVYTTTPTRAKSCLEACWSIYQTVPYVSEDALNALVLMSTSSHLDVLHKAQKMLTTVLRSIAPRPCTTDVQMRFCSLGEMEKDAPDPSARRRATEVFCARLAAIRRAYPLASLGHTGEQFLPRTLAVPGVYPPGDDGEGEEEGSGGVCGDGLPLCSVVPFRVHRDGVEGAAGVAPEYREQLSRWLLGTAEDYASAAQHVRSTRLWQFAVSREDDRDGNAALPPIWRPVALLLGEEAAVAVFPALVDALLAEFAQRLENPTVNKESVYGLFANAFDVAMALLHRSVRIPGCRRVAFATYLRLALSTLDARVPNNVSRLLLRSIITMSGTVTTDELWQLFDAFCAQLEARPGDIQLESRAARFLLQLVFEFRYEASCELLPRMLARVLSSRQVFLQSASQVSRMNFGSFLRQLTRLMERQSDLLPFTGRNLAVVGDFFSELRKALGFFFARSSVSTPPPPPTDEGAAEAQPHLWVAAAPPNLLATVPSDTATAAPPTLDPLLSMTPALRPRAAPPLDAFATPALRAQGQPPDAVPLSLGAASTAEPAAFTAPELALVETCCVLLWSPCPAAVEGHWPFMVELFTRMLDTPQPGGAMLHERATSSLVCLTSVRVSKGVAHEMVLFLCDAITGAGGLSFGATRKAKVALTTALRLLLFTNLHRIGKYTMLSRVAEAALCAMGHGDGQLRTEGKLLLSVLAKVASVEQAQSLLTGYTQRLRHLPAHSAAPGRRERTALVLALCALLLAEPAHPPPYTPMLMRRLVAYANDVVPELRAAVRATVQEWFRAHRDDWEEFKTAFTAAQVEDILAVLASPSYYA